VNAHSRSRRFLVTPAHLLLFVAFCTGLGLFCAKPVCAAHLPLKTYTVADGLPHNAISCIVRDSRGFLWFCTAEGLSLFDGYRFTNFGVAQGLPHPYVTAILETRDGEYWVATYDGLCKLDPKGIAGKGVAEAIGTRTNAAAHPMFTVFRPAGGDHRASAFTTLLQGRDGTIWCGTRNGLFRLVRAGGLVRLLPIDVALPTSYAEERFVLALLEDRYGTLWVGAASGLCRRWPDGTAIRYTGMTGLPADYIHALLEDRHGHVWVGTRHRGLFELTIDASHRTPTVARAYNRGNGFIADWIFDVKESEDGRLWVGANTGLAEFSADDRQRDQPSHVYDKASGFIYHEIAIVSEDRDGNIWLGTVNGAMKLARNGFLAFGQDDGILTATPLFELDKREMYFSGYVHSDARTRVPGAGRPPVRVTDTQQYWFGIGRFDGERFTWLRPIATERQDISWSDKRFVARTRAGEWWIGRFRFRVSSFARLETARPAAEYTTKDGLASPVVHSLFEDSRGDVWISTMSSTGSGLARWDHATGTMHDMAPSAGLPRLKDRLPCAFEEDRGGGVWIGFERGGVARYAAGRFRMFTTDDGLPDGEIADLHVDRNGRLWVGTSGGGLARVDDPTATHPAFVVYSAVQGLSSNTVTAVTDDLYGRIYVATGRGLDRFSPSTGRVRHFTSADGLPSGEIRAAYREADGALWFGTRSGLLRYVPEPERRSQRPSVFITGLSIAGEKHDVSALGETDITLGDLDADRNQVQLDFVALSFATGEALSYEYKLDPGDNWSAPSDQRTLNLANLAPGRYQFLVRAINSDGIVSAIPASLSFTVLPPVWQRWWFRSLGALTAGLIAYSLYRYRLRRLLALERMRTRIAMDLHDEIGSNLSLIAMVSEVAGRTAKQDDPQVAHWLSLIASTSRETVDAMSDIVWIVNPNKDRLGDLTQRMRRVADEACSAANIALVFVTPADESGLKLGIDTRRELFLIFKEAMNNIVRHAHCTETRIELGLDSDALQLRLNDNGRGFDVSGAATGNGLASMRRRAQHVGGDLDISSVTTGTTIRLRVPLGSSRLKFPR
jgi:ligand-binding sensor domain-containing protein/signal transduction histidine kinase